MNTAADGLEVDRVHVWRGERHVLKGVSLQLHSSELLHICGQIGVHMSLHLRSFDPMLRVEVIHVHTR